MQLYDSTFLLCPWEAPACFLWDLTGFHTEWFSFMSLGSWDSWRLCFEIHVLTSNDTALLLWYNSVRSLSSPCYDLLRPSSFSLWCPSPSQSFSAAGCPQGEMTAWEEAKGRECQAFPGFWGEQGSWKVVRRVSQESDYAGKAGLWRHLFHCLCLLYLFQAAPAYAWGDIPEALLDMTGQITHTNVGPGISGLMGWFNQGQLNLETEYSNLEILDLDLRNL